MRIEFKKLPAQAQVFDDEKTKILLFSGGLGSGKTFLLCMKMIRLSYLNGAHSGGIMCPSYPELKRDILPTFQEILYKNRIKYRYHNTEKWFHFPWMRPSARLYLFSAERPLAGPNLAYAGMNEMSLIPKQRFYETLRRVRVKGAKCMQSVLVGTPEDKYDILEEFVASQSEAEAKRPGSFKVVHASTSENVHIDEGYAEHLRSVMDSRALEVFLSGQIVRLHGNFFYYAFSTEKNVAPVEMIEDVEIHASLDFNIGRMTTTFWQKFGIEARCFDELVLLGNSDTHEMAKAIKARFPRSITLHVDASSKARKTTGLSDLEALRSHGFANIRIKATNPTFRDRQILVNGKLEKGEIKINPKCKALIKDLKSVRQEKSDFSKDKSVAELTHASDTLDYFVFWEYPLNIHRQSKTIQL